MLARHGKHTSTMSEPAYASPSCEDLARRIQSGDRTAFSLLVERHLPRLLAIAQRTGLSRTEAEDVAQDVLIKFWQQPELYQPGKARFSTWIYRVTVNRTLDCLRRHGRMQALPEDYDATDPAPSALEDMAKRQRRLVLVQAIAGLPERQRAALALSYQGGLPDAEAAAALGVSVKAYEALLVRARRQLRTVLLKEGDHDSN